MSLVVSVITWTRNAGEDGVVFRWLMIHKVSDWLLARVVFIALVSVARVSLRRIYSPRHRVLILLLLFDSIELPRVQHTDPSCSLVL